MSHSLVLGVMHEGAPYVSALAHLPGHALGGVVHFQVDTGASTTMLCPADAERLGIDYAYLPLPVRLGTIGNQVLAHEAECVLTFTAYDELTQFRTTIAVLNPSTTRLQRSLLGMDILGRCSLMTHAEGMSLEPTDADGWIARGSW